MKIHFAIQCHNFQQRMCWQLSSIAQQLSAHSELPKYQFSEPIPPEIGSLPEIVIDIAYMPNNGTPRTEDVIWYFRRRGLRIIDTVVKEQDVFAKRGIVRNLQIANASSSDYIFFADCDNVYHPYFFSMLARQLERIDTTQCVYSREKYHTDVEATNQLARLALTNKGINYAYERAHKIPRIKKGNRNCAAGCMQVVRTDATGGYYVKQRECRDSHLFRSGQRAKSDMQFRSRMGGSYRISLPAQVHLNHNRDKSAGQHITEQR